MGVLDDKIDVVDREADAAILRVQEDVAKLEADIQDLKDQIANDGATPERLAKLDRLEAKLRGLDPLKPDTLPPPE